MRCSAHSACSAVESFLGGVWGCARFWLDSAELRELQLNTEETEETEEKRVDALLCALCVLGG